MMILLYLISISETAACYRFLEKTVWRDIVWNKKKICLAGAGLVLAGVCLAYRRAYQFFSLEGLASCMIIMGIFSCILAGRKFFRAVEAVVLYSTFTALLDYFLGFVSMGLLKKDFQELVLFHGPILWRIGIYVCSRGILALLIVLLERKLTCAFLLECPKALAVLCGAGLVLLWKYKERMIVLLYTGPDKVWMGVCVPALMLFLGIVAIKILYNFRKREEYELLALKNKMLQKQYREQELMFQQKQKLLHDVKNHILTLQGLEQDGDLEGLHRYLQSLEAAYYNAGKTLQMQQPYLKHPSEPGKRESRAEGYPV